MTTETHPIIFSSQWKDAGEIACTDTSKKAWLGGPSNAVVQFLKEDEFVDFKSLIDLFVPVKEPFMNISECIVSR